MRPSGILAWVFWICFYTFAALAQVPGLGGVEAVGITVSDLDRAVDFYTGVLHFQKESETELAGPEVEHLKGLFGVRLRSARLRLGSEEIELTEYLAPQGRPIPADSRSNDLWFQHLAIVVSDMDQAYRYLREHHMVQASSCWSTWRRAMGAEFPRTHEPTISHIGRRSSNLRTQMRSGPISTRCMYASFRSPCSQRPTSPSFSSPILTDT
jgi:catechol 2,3-dioxygenase-like lactoylglutathione lyase family enzyme